MNDKGTHRLSRRESEVLQLACQGMTDKEIAGELGIAWPTVRTYISRLMVKTGVTNRTQLGVVTADAEEDAPSELERDLSVAHDHALEQADGDEDGDE